LKDRHPWWNALVQFRELDKAGKSISKHLTPKLIKLAGDAKKISVLQRNMPDSIKRKFKRDLVDNERAIDYIFEVMMAWHFFSNDCKILWHGGNSTNHSEFLVKEQKFDFNLECKRISVDASKKIRRRDFYRFADIIIPLIQELGYFGSIDITLSDKFHGSDDFINKLSNEIISNVKPNQLNGKFEFSFGILFLNLKTASEVVVNLSECLVKLQERLPHQAHGVIIAKSKSGQSIDPVEMTLTSEKSGNVLKDIRKKLSKAAKNQLPQSEPGVIVCYLEGINDLSELATDSGLQLITSAVLSKEKYTHIAAIGYCSESMIYRDTIAEEHFNQSLIFKNPNCKFEKARNFDFLSDFNSQD